MFFINLNLKIKNFKKKFQKKRNYKISNGSNDVLLYFNSHFFISLIIGLKADEICLDQEKNQPKTFVMQTRFEVIKFGLPK